MTANDDYVPSRSLPTRITRRLTQWRVADALGVQPGRAIVSFTFDDFPKSAASTGAEIIESAGGRATYYACTSLARTHNTTGEQFDETDIAALVKSGHEIGAHSHSHIDCAKAELTAIEADIEANMMQLHEMGAQDITQFAYPYGETRFAVKRALRDQFKTVRGILSGANTARSDRMQLRALQLTEEDWTTDRALKTIEAAARKPAWVIVFTHDVRNRNSSYGTTPEALKKLATAARDSGAEILTVSDAMKVMEAGRNV